MNRALLTVVVVASAGVAHADPAYVLEGTVVDRATGLPVVGAVVIAEHAGRSVADEAGHFGIVLALPGKQPLDREITVAANGYQTQRAALASLVVRIELEPAAGSELIEMTGKAPEETKPLSYQLTSDEIRSLPGAGNDILRAAQSLPGVARIPYAFGGLVLRGTSPRDTSVYLDGIEVPIAFHFGGVTSFYPSAMLDDLELTAGGFGVEYGRAQGGLATLTTREPRTDRWRVGGSIGLLDSGVSAEGPAGSGGVLISVRRSYFDTVARPFVSDDIPLPNYWDAQIRGSFGDPRRSGRITPIVFLSLDGIANNRTGRPGHENEISVGSGFARIALPYLRIWKDLTIHLVPWLGINTLSFESTQDGATETYTRPVYPGGVRADLTRDFPWGQVSGGVDAEAGYLSHTQIGFTGNNQGPMQMDGTTTVTWANVAMWSEARFKIDGERFAVKPGLRVEGYGLSGEVVIDPRINVHQKLTDRITLRQALGRYHQPPTPGDLDPQDGNPFLESSYVDQASLGADADLGDYSASVTGFYNDEEQLGVRQPRPSDAVTPTLGGLGPTFELLLEKELGFAFYRTAIGRGKSYGLEWLVKRSFGRWFGMLAYTLSKAERTEDPSRFAGWRPFELDQRHNLNLAVSTMIGRWRLGGRIQLVSGNPYSPSVRSHGMVVQQPWAGELPTFFQLDLRADRRWPQCWGDVNLYIDVQNVTNRRNVEGREWDDFQGRDVDIPGLPIVPFIGVEFVPR